MSCRKEVLMRRIFNYQKCFFMSSLKWHDVWEMVRLKAKKNGRTGFLWLLIVMFNTDSSFRLVLKKTEPSLNYLLI